MMKSILQVIKLKRENEKKKIKKKKLVQFKQAKQVEEEGKIKREKSQSIKIINKINDM